MTGATEGIAIHGGKIPGTPISIELSKHFEKYRITHPLPADTL
jgi:hypothetical protein